MGLLRDLASMLVMSDEKGGTMMPNETSSKHGTGEFPPPRKFDGAGKSPLDDAYSAWSVMRRARQDSDPQMAPLKTVGLLCAVALAVMMLGVVLSLTGCISETSAASQLRTEAVAGTSGQLGSLPVDENRNAGLKSTPRAEWKLGTTPKLYQTDPEWAYAFYAEGTMLTHGCGPTALAMAYVRLTGNTDHDPRAMARLATENGFIDNGVTSWLLMSDGARMLGLQSHEVSANAEAVKAELMQDNQVICSVHKGDFTNEGHFILLTDMNPDGTVEIRDPNSEARTAQMWDLDRIISQCDNIWALSKEKDVPLGRS